MRGRMVTAIVLLIASAAGLGVMLVMQPEKTDEPETINVAAANTNLVTFSVVGENDLAPQPIPRTDYKKDIHFAYPLKEQDMSEEDYAEKLKKELYDQVCKRTVVYSMFKGDLITKPKLAEGQGITPLIPENMRAVSIDLGSASSMVAGLIMPRNLVDIISAPKKMGDSAKTLLESVEILAVNQMTQYEESGDGEASKTKDTISSVTVLLKPEDVLTLEEAKVAGSITLSLRSNPVRPPDTDTEPEPKPKPVTPPSPEIVAEGEKGIPETLTPPPAETDVWLIRTLRNMQWGSIEVLDGATQDVEPSLRSTQRQSTQSYFVVEADSKSFAEDVVDRSQQRLVVVLFRADWCKNCRLVEPVLEKIAEEYDGDFSLVRIDFDRSRDIARQHELRGVPSLVPYKNGKRIDSQMEGIPTDDSLRKWLDELISLPMAARAGISSRI